MKLAPIDWAIIAGYLLVALGIGFWYSRRAGKSITEFFLAGRSLPWWIAGTSIVATSFAADTPLAVSAFVRKGGIYENWFWWSALMGGMLMVFFYARLWHRAGILTNIEFNELRYHGTPAAALRGFMAVYRGVLTNCIIMGWIMLAMAKIGTEAMGIPESVPLSLGGVEVAVSGKLLLLTVLVVIALIYTIVGGLWGVVMTDLLQFIIAMVGSIALAVIVVRELGGPSEMVQKISDSPGVSPQVFSFIPDFKTAGKLAIFTFAVYVSVQWWGNAQGNGIIVQRLMSTKNEKHAAMAAIWNSFAHYVLRTWPWVIVGLASLVFFTYQTGEDSEAVYPRMVLRFMPAGLRGLMIVSFLAAFMSSIDTDLNWGSSVLINDLYRRFIKTNGTERHYVAISRITILLLMVLGALAAWQMESIRTAWKYFAKLTAGAGFVWLLRWYWWRINPWSEISALLCSLILTNLLPLMTLPGIGFLGADGMYPVQLVIIVIVSTVVWLTVTFLTRPVDIEQLKEFYRRVRPGGWWGPIARLCPEVKAEKGASRGWIGWIAGVICVYCGLFGVGFLCLGRFWSGTGFLIACAATGWVMITQASAISGIGEPSEVTEGQR
jgi:SSS family solute:Na+ symporter